MVVRGGVLWSYNRRRRRAAHFSSAAAALAASARERALEQRTRWTGVFSGFTGVIHFTCDLC